MSLMRAVTFPRFGGPEELRCTEVACPEPAAAEVLIRTHAAGICYHDVLSRGGHIPRDKPGQILGHEIAGEIVGLGAGVPQSRLGERVVVYVRLHCGHCRYCLGGRPDLCRDSRVVGEHGGGGYAEYTTVPSRNAVRVPDGLSLEHAAMACCPIGTSVRAVLGVAQAGPGDVVLVTGAGGGLGLHQIQVAKSVGAHVIAVTSSDSKVETIRAVGADEVVVSPDLRFSAEVWQRTGKQGADIILENVVTGTIGESLRSAAQNAAIVVLGNIGARKVEMDPGLIIMRRLRIMGSGNATYQDLRRALHLMATGKVRPMIDRVLPFAEASDGHALMENRATTGRVLLSGWG
ncbi:alcohol dehydrogenase catalytic domain-containing protein [Humitalea sp. 24SJ18S-53]|uniref:alcohol dehydrogenase catalytic domain-containing protein n=1 Tax=Humitalea sp. 24SJ18S-53 TaxID=3422307 RepID=UPI003D67B76C